MNLFRKIFIALIVVALLAGCASFTYNRLDWLIPWYVDGYVDLTGDQRALLRERLTPSLEWHRREELARYMEIIDRIEADLDGPVDSATVRGWADDMLAAARDWVPPTPEEHQALLAAAQRQTQAAPKRRRRRA